MTHNRCVRAAKAADPRAEKFPMCLGRAVLRCKNREPELAVASGNDEASMPFAAAQSQEEGFKIYSPEEQQQRRKKTEQENEERLKLLEEKMARVAAALAERATSN